MHTQEKPVSIPEAPKERGPRDPPEFVRFYMGKYIIITVNSMPPKMDIWVIVYAALY